jgi:WD40 repeat protein
MKLRILLIALLMSVVMPGAYASRLPDNLWEYIKKDFPNATQRFDSVVIISKDLMYVPLYPAQRNDVEKIEMDYTYPQGKTLKALPEVAIFNNNFVLLKLYKDKSGNFTVVDNDSLPLKVKLGVMPQDMLVPAGMKIPENLKIVLGDLVIPSINEGSLIVNSDGTEQKSKPLEGQVAREFLTNQDSFYALNELKNKKAYISTNGSKFVTVYDETSPKALYELKLEALPSKMAASNSSKFAVVLYFKNKTPEVLDLENEKIISKIELDGEAKDVQIDPKTNLAYISCPNANTIYAVDLDSANIKKAIKLTQAPSKIAIHTTKPALAFVDWTTQDLCVLELSDEYYTRVLGQVVNPAAILYDGDEVYDISRTQNKIVARNHITGGVQSEILLHKKPVDAVLYKGKIFVLCAQDGYVDVYDIKQKKLIKSINLERKGFYSKITKIPDSSNAFLTGFDTGNFLVFSFETMSIVKSQPFDLQVSNMMIIDK